MKINYISFIEKYFSIIIIAPHPTTIGNTAEEIFFGILNAEKNGKKLLLLRPYQIKGLNLPLVNKSLFKIRSKYISKNKIAIILGSTILTIYFGYFRFINKLKIHKLNFSESYTQPKFGRERLWNEENYLNFNKKNYEKLNWQGIYEKNIEVNLDEDINSKGEKLIRGLGVKEGQWYVCLHVRESGYWKDEIGNSYRNASIYNYVAAIERINEMGGVTIRMGDPTMTKLPPMDGFIDYPFTDYKTDQMDMYLIKNCRLFIGMQSGIFDVAVLFSKPLIITNMVSWLFPFPPKKGDLGILKRVYDQKHKKEIKLRERLNSNWELAGHIVNVNEYCLIENSSEEILEVVDEYFNGCGEDYDMNLQNNFNSQRKARGLEIIEQEKSLDLTEKYRLFSRLNSVDGALGNYYLKKYY